jgi:glycosyltransferase involved in cell wall biosynthesis
MNVAQSSVAYIGQYPQSDARAFSGTNITIFTSLCKATHAIDLSGYAQAPSRCYQLLSRLSSGFSWAPSALPYHCWKNVKFLAPQIAHRANKYTISKILCPSSIAVAACKYPIPVPLKQQVMLYTDATVKSLVGYYPEWKTVYQKSFLSACEIEAFAFGVASRIVVASDWAASSVIDDYGIDSKKVAVLPRPANLTEDPGPINEVILHMRRQNINLITIASSWHRKGLPLCVEATAILRSMGLPASLLVIGLDPSEFLDATPEYVTAYPRINKHEASGHDLFYSVMKMSSIFLFPTRAEAMGISLAEACAFSLPILASNTGGVSTVVRPGSNGILLSLDSTAEDYAKNISMLLANDSMYSTMCRNSYHFYKKTFNALDLGSRLLHHLEQM